jgi:hypothetical protein
MGEPWQPFVEPAYTTDPRFYNLSLFDSPISDEGLSASIATGSRLSNIGSTQYRSLITAISLAFDALFTIT